MRHKSPDRKLNEIKANLTNFGETGVIVDKWDSADGIDLANANFIKTTFHEEIWPLERRNKIAYGLMIASKGP